MKKRILVFAAIAFASLLWATNDPFIGTWKLNLAESRAPFPLPKSQVTKIEAQSDGFIKSTNDIVQLNGSASHTEWVGKRDGKDYALRGGPTGYTIAIMQIDANSLEEINKINGKEVLRYQVTVSKDGKTMTATGKWKNANGQELTGVSISNKQ